RRGERIRFLIKNMFGQIQVLRVFGPGALHAFFFWGFGLLFIGTLLVMAQADFTDIVFGWVFLKGTFYEIFSLVLDVAGLVAIIMLAGLLIRRFVFKPEGLETTRDDYVAHGLLFVILITGFIIEALRMADTELRQHADFAVFSPVGMGLGQLFLTASPDTLTLWHKLTWWFHFLLSMCFIALIPFTKLRHIFTTSTNYLFTDLRARGSLDLINLEEEGVEQFGASKVTDLAWKDIFDADACMTCKRCQERCPAYATGKPLSPMKVVRQIGEAASTGPSSDLIATVTEDVLWACTTCYACQDICPARIEHVNKILEMRRDLSLMKGSFSGDEVRTAVNNIEVNGNPFGLAFAERGEWAAGLDVKIMEQDASVDILYFAGCFASFDKRNRDVARNFIRICNAAGVKVGILGKQEKCCGEPPRKLGNEYLYQNMASSNIEVIKAYGVKKIVTTCPHCFNTLKRDYRDLGLDTDVEHYSTFVNHLVTDGRLRMKPSEFEFVYHDSCYLGRYMNVFEEPRSVLRAAGGRIREMEKSRSNSFCCGGGGGWILAEEKIGTRINATRVGMAAATGAPLLVSNCPFCLTMFEDGIKTTGNEEKMKVKDLAEVVAERLEKNI
ncbi:MAG TPA: heterodisulfide reductase-related iron-sulfur binding cluster, partial [Nitrospirota bacterium]|nr:heterodisulfide reductase-related iron-sulfur binding cluster [Nitrospirota bacterium]